jgi:hypothetical protein
VRNRLARPSHELRLDDLKAAAPAALQLEMQEPEGE